MNHFTRTYINEFSKTAGIGELAKSIFIDPAVGIFTDSAKAINAGIEGDWAGAGGHALGALGNGIATAGNAMMLIPGIGTAAGLGVRALGLGARGALALGKAAPLAAKATSGMANVFNAGAKNVGKLRTAMVGDKANVAAQVQNAVSTGKPQMWQNAGLYGKIQNASARAPFGKLIFGDMRAGGKGGVVRSFVGPVVAGLGIAGTSAAGHAYSKDTAFDNIMADDDFRRFMGNEKYFGQLRQRAEKENTIKGMFGLGTGVQQYDELKNNGILDSFNQYKAKRKADPGSPMSDADAEALTRYYMKIKGAPQ